MAKADDHCPECGVFVKPENMASHLRKAHGKAEEAARIERQRPVSRRRRGSRPFPISMVLLIAFIAVVASGAYFAYQTTTPSTEGLQPLTEMCVQHTPSLLVHIHPHVAIEILGNPYTIPANIGIVSSSCFRPLHTHNTSGTIHVELPDTRAVYLKDFFTIWGKPFARDRILTYVEDATHEVVMSVDGVVSGAYENLALLDGQRILIAYQNR